MNFLADDILNRINHQMHSTLVIGLVFCYQNCSTKVVSAGPKSGGAYALLAGHPTFDIPVVQL